MDFKKLLICVVLFAVSNNLFSQELEQDLFPFESSMPQYNNNIGFTASLFSGLGFHYKRNISREHSVKAVFFGWHTTEEKNTENVFINTKSSDVYISFGMEYHYLFLRQKKLDLYALAGARTWYSEYSDPSRYYFWEINNINSIGLGVGLESRLGKHFVVNADIGFTKYWKLERIWGQGELLFERNYTTSFGFAGGVGIGFIF